MNKRKALAMFLVIAMLVSLFSASAYATGSFEPVSIGEGEPVTINWTNSTSGTVFNKGGSTYIPERFLLWVEGTNTVTLNGNLLTADMSNTGNDGYIITTGTASQTIVVNITESTINAEGTYTISCPAKNGSAPASVVNSVAGYLPVGQFAKGVNWGSANGKFTSKGYETTGVSLGAAGGYIQMNLKNHIYNYSTNPYGVDFIVYGNAFNGNPEAGAVKVFGHTSESDPGAWYDLAGSLYYDSISKNNATVSYKRISDGDNKGIYYKINTGEWTLFTKNITWWPTHNDYQDGWGNVDGVTWDKTNDIITYSGVSLVKDTDLNNDYQFGYFDVHVNGSNYGVAQNPYTITNTQSGGDGFDISWAVDSEGNPVNLIKVSKVRVYTAAALNSDGTAFTTPSIFGETSAEFCGIYPVTGTGSGNTNAPTITTEGSDFEDNYDTETISVSANQQIITVYNASGIGNIEVLGNDNVYINGVNTSTVSINVASGETKIFQIINQQGTAAPFVTLLKLEG